MKTQRRSEFTFVFAASITRAGGGWGWRTPCPVSASFHLSGVCCWVKSGSSGPAFVESPSPLSSVISSVGQLKKKGF